MILIVFSHPYPNKSHANRYFLERLKKLDNIVISDLYEQYPDFYINIDREQQRLMAAELIVFQFPVYWYNVPALFKQWQESVLSHGFAFGKQPKENKLENNKCVAVITTGHKQSSYSPGQFDNYRIEDFLRPLEQMSAHCKMNYQPPLVLHQAHKASEQELNDFSRQYIDYIHQLYRSV